MDKKELGKGKKKGLRWTRLPLLKPSPRGEFVCVCVWRGGILHPIGHIQAGIGEKPKFSRWKLKTMAEMC